MTHETRLLTSPGHCELRLARAPSLSADLTGDMPCPFWIDPMPTGSAIQSHTCHLGCVGAIVAKAARQPAMQRCGYRRHSQSPHSSIFSVDTCISFNLFQPSFFLHNGHGSSGNNAVSSGNVQRGADKLRHPHLSNRCLRWCSFRVSHFSLSFLFVKHEYVLLFPECCCSWLLLT